MAGIFIFSLQFDFRELIELKENMEVVDVPFWNLSDSEQAGKYTFAWCLKTGSRDIWFAAKSLATKKKWMQAIQGCLDEMKDEKGARPDVATRGDAQANSSTKRPTMSVPQPAGSSKSKPKPANKSKKAAAAKGSYEQWEPIQARGGGGGGGGNADDGGDAGGKSAFSSAGDEGWFGGKIQRPKAEKILEGAADGTFLVRESHTRPVSCCVALCYLDLGGRGDGGLATWLSGGTNADPHVWSPLEPQGDYSLSVQYDNNVKHIKINRHGNMYDVAPDAKAFPSIQVLAMFSFIFC